MRVKGFTLVELLVVMTILAGLFALITPRVGGGREGLEFRGAVRNLVADLRRTRAFAIAHNRPARLVVDLAGRRYRLEATGTERSLPPAANVTLLTAVEEIVDATIGAVVFFPDGGSTGGRVVIDHKGRRSDVQIDWLTGRVSVVR